MHYAPCSNIQAMAAAEPTDISTSSRICPATEYGRNREGERRMKRYNGIVLLEVGGLSGMSEAELVKEQAALLPKPMRLSQEAADGA